jgi:Streptomycin adenylyltransferase
MIGRAWLDNLPSELDGQKAIMRRLLEASEADERIRWLGIGCSLGRDAADSLSDLDMAIGVRDADLEAARPDIRALADGLEELVESYYHQLPQVAGSHERIFVQYADRCQLDLVVFPASTEIGAVRNLVVLYDPDDQIVLSPPKAEVSTQQVREWAFQGWCALADFGKYLRRRSLWEALSRLNEARDQFWRLWAVAVGVPDATYGLTSVMDYAPGTVPEAAEGTVADLDAARLLAAAQRLARLLAGIGPNLTPAHRSVLPDAMGRFITDDLDSLATGAVPTA